MSNKIFNEIVEKAIAGDNQAFIQLCEIKGRDILYFSIKLMNNRQDGEDAAQEILLHMQKKLSGLQHPEAFNVWMYRIIHSVCMDFLRKNKKRKNQIFYEENTMTILEDRKDFLPYDFAVDEEKKEILLEIIHQLPYKCKMCVLLFYYQNMSYSDIGQILHITIKDVDNTMIKAKKLIKRELEKEERTKKYLKNAYAVAPLPVLTKLFESDITAVVPSEAVKQMLEISPVTGGTAAAAVKGAVTAGKETVLSGKAAGSGTGSSGVSGGMGVAAKVTVGIIVTLGVAVGSMAYINNRTKDKTVQNSSFADAEEYEIPPESSEEPAEADEDFDINVLEDMIGDDAAVELRNFCSVGSAGYQEALIFLEEQGMLIEESVAKLESGVEHTLYVLQKQNKLLMVILERKQSEDRCGLVYHFSEIQEVPRSMEIEASYEEWK